MNTLQGSGVTKTMTIWKYLLTGHQVSISMPIGAEILDVQIQGGRPHIWVKCDPDAEPTMRHFRVFGTGAEDVKGNYIGTFQTQPFVWHLFEVDQVDAALTIREWNLQDNGGDDGSD